MPEYVKVTAEVPDNAGWCGIVARQQVTELKVINMVADNGRIAAYLGDYQVALTPEMWGVLLTAVLKSVGPTRSLHIPATTIAEKLDAAAKVKDNGEAFGKTLNDFIGSLGGAR